MEQEQGSLKYPIIATLVFLCGVIAVIVTHYRIGNREDAAYIEWRRTTVEAETKVRPPHYEGMKWTPEPEVRAPATSKKK